MGDIESRLELLYLFETWCERAKFQFLVLRSTACNTVLEPPDGIYIPAASAPGPKEGVPEYLQ